MTLDCNCLEEYNKSEKELHGCTPCDAFPETNTMREQEKKWTKLIIQSDSELQ